MLNMHIGLPGVYPNLIHDLSRQRFFRERSNCYVMSRAVWQDKLRGLVNSPPGNTELQYSARQAMELILTDAAQSKFFAASQSALLGKIEDCFLRNVVLPRAEDRVKNLAQIFEKTPITFHLTVPCQFDYLIAAAMKGNKRFCEIRSIPSWANLIGRIKLSVPDSKLVVWSFEQPEKMILAFVVSLINNHDPRFAADLKKYLAGKIQHVQSKQHGQRRIDVSEDLAVKLDAEHERDLQLIGKMNGVLLVLPSSVPPDLYIQTP